MRYALTGSHGVGKTSVINGIEDFLIDKGIACITNSSKARSIKALGFKINDKADDITELLIASNHISNFSKDNWFADRCIIDTWAYALWNYGNGLINGKTFHTIDHLAVKFVALFDEIFYIPIEFPMVEDGIRVNDENYRKVIDEKIRSFLQTYKKDNYHILSGCVDDRVDKIKGIITP
jgi:thymidylate kinase